MGQVAIRSVDLGKQYRIRLRGRPRTLSEAITNAATAPFGRARARSGQSAAAEQEDDRIWVLRHASFVVAPGEVVGIIGRNGAGKSTLLKVLSRIVRPTEGNATIYGRIASLLEVGTGFHAELSGRENIYLNGAILGMRKAEIARNFDEIVAFAEVEQFLDTPVKHYSTGMYTRLAFAVAAHLEPEILIVDEVLAVGDAAFQRKCLGRMEIVARDGRTVLFVSHNMDAVRRLCTRVMLIERGEIVNEGRTGKVVAAYLSRDTGPSGPESWIDLSRASRAGTGEAHFVSARYSSLSHAFACFAYPDGPLNFTLVIQSDQARTVNSMSVKLCSPAGTKLLDADIITLGESLRLVPGQNSVQLHLDKVHLTPGAYYVGLWLGDSHGRTFDQIDAAFSIDVVDAGEGGFGTTATGLVPCRFRFLQDQPR